MKKSFLIRIENLKETKKKVKDVYKYQTFSGFIREAIIFYLGYLEKENEKKANF